MSLLKRFQNWSFERNLKKVPDFSSMEKIEKRSFALLSIAYAAGQDSALMNRAVMTGLDWLEKKTPDIGYSSQKQEFGVIQDLIAYAEKENIERAYEVSAVVLARANNIEQAQLHLKFMHDFNIHRWSFDRYRGKPEEYDGSLDLKKFPAKENAVAKASLSIFDRMIENSLKTKEDWEKIFAVKQEGRFEPDTIQNARKRNSLEELGKFVENSLRMANDYPDIKEQMIEKVMYALPVLTNKVQHSFAQSDVSAFVQNIVLNSLGGKDAFKDVPTDQAVFFKEIVITPENPASHARAFIYADQKPETYDISLQHFAGSSAEFKDKHRGHKPGHETAEDFFHKSLIQTIESPGFADKMANSPSLASVFKDKASSQTAVLVTKPFINLNYAANM